MSESIDDPGFPPLEEQPAPPPEELAPPRRRSWAWLAWIVIVGLAIFMVLGRTKPHEDRDKNEETSLAGTMMTFQARYAVGANSIFHQKTIYEGMAKIFRQGGVEQRLRFLVLANELAGPKEALQELDLLNKDIAKHQIKLTPDQARLLRILGRLFTDYNKGLVRAFDVDEADLDFVRQRLHWLGDLVLAPPPPAAVVQPQVFRQRKNFPDRDEVLAPARRTFLIVFVAFILGLFIAFAGLIGLIVFIVFVSLGKVKGMPTGTGNGGIYAETFAVWFLLFVGQSFVFSLLSLGLPPLVQAAAVMFLSLIALGWPVLRGIPWRQVREDLGLTFGKNPFLEPIIGLGCYAMALPIVAIGLIVTLVLLQAQRSVSDAAGNPFAPNDLPTHPIVESLAHGGWTELLGVIFLASVAAPLIEETMFRGVLYRHLREASARFGPIVSFIVSATLVSFLFAVIHPQGIFAVPVLMALAFGFTIAREWRGSLVPAMVGHALNNGVVTLVLAAALGD